MVKKQIDKVGEGRWSEKWSEIWSGKWSEKLGREIIVKKPSEKWKEKIQMRKWRKNIR